MVAGNRGLERGRELCARRAWVDGYESLLQADGATLLGAADLELLARAAYMLGRDDDYVIALERAHHAHVAEEQPLGAVRCAFFIGLNLMPRGETTRATGWFGRAQRLLERETDDCVERGYLLIPILLGHLASGDSEAAYDTACAASDIAERFNDDDLLALAWMERGHALVRRGRAEEGLRLVDEVLVAVAARELSPVVTGIVYCNTINFCAGQFELRRAREWTEAFTRWCDDQPDMVAHTGVCLVHRAEIMELEGAWSVALDEARRAYERSAYGLLNGFAVGKAMYRQGEVRRLRGEFADAEHHYREASRGGYEPQPGLAMLRLAQGKTQIAAAAIRRVVDETSGPLDRARLLPSYVEIMIAVGDLDAAGQGCSELASISVRQRGGMLGAMSAHAEGTVALARGDPTAALSPLRHAWHVWQELGAPYEAARVRVLVGLACRALGDEDTALLEFDVARESFTALGAQPDRARLEAIVRGAAFASNSGLTSRELEVLLHLAAGATNKTIAAKLLVSERTVDRHVSNIFTKLAVTSRAAATAYAYENQLV